MRNIQINVYAEMPYKFYFQKIL